MFQFSNNFPIFSRLFFNLEFLTGKILPCHCDNFWKLSVFSAQHSSTLSSSMHPPPPHHGMPMYHSPYSGSPTPPPPPVGPRPIVTHPPTIRSRSITPTSTHRIRIHPQHSTSTHGSVKSPDQTPQGHKKDRVRHFWISQMWESKRQKVSKFSVL